MVMRHATWWLLLSALAYCTTRPADDCSADVLTLSTCAHRLRHHQQYKNLADPSKFTIVALRYQMITLDESNPDCKIYRLIPENGWQTPNVSLVRTIKGTVSILLHSKLKACYPNAHYYLRAEKWYAVPYDFRKMAGGRYPTMMTSTTKAPKHWTKVLEGIISEGESLLPWRIERVKPYNVTILGRFARANVSSSSILFMAVGKYPDTKQEEAVMLPSDDHYSHFEDLPMMGTLRFALERVGLGSLYQRVQSWYDDIYTLVADLDIVLPLFGLLYYLVSNLLGDGAVTLCVTGALTLYLWGQRQV